MKKKLAVALTALVSSVSLFAGSVSAASYTVKPGDYLWKIATANGTTVQTVMEINGLTNTYIYPGQVLQLPAEKGDYTVQENDTMWLISQKFSIPMNALLNANPQIADPSNIWHGLTLHIPQKPPAFTNGSFPLGKGTYQPYTNTYGDSRAWAPNGTATRSHDGVDIFAKKGTPIYSAADGKIVNFGWNQYGGWRITVKVDDTTVFYYAHMSKYAPGMGMGAYVKKGQLIGYVGNSGYGPEGTEGNFLPHLHFGIYKTNASPWYTIDPYIYLRWWEVQ